MILIKLCSDRDFCSPSDQGVAAAFEKAVETIRGLGYPMSSTAAPFDNPSRGIANISAFVTPSSFPNLTAALIS